MITGFTQNYQEICGKWIKKCQLDTLLYWRVYEIKAQICINTKHYIPSSSDQYQMSKSKLATQVNYFLPFDLGYDLSRKIKIKQYSLLGLIRIFVRLCQKTTKRKQKRRSYFCVPTKLSKIHRGNTFLC